MSPRASATADPTPDTPPAPPAAQVPATRNARELNSESEVWIITSDFEGPAKTTVAQARESEQSFYLSEAEAWLVVGIRLQQRVRELQERAASQMKEARELEDAAETAFQNAGGAHS